MAPREERPRPGDWLVGPMTQAGAKEILVHEVLRDAPPLSCQMRTWEDVKLELLLEPSCCHVKRPVRQRADRRHT